MKKTLILAFAASTLLGATAVSAQTVEFGARGPSIDMRNERQRERDYRREREERRADRYERVERRGCRTVTVREETGDGRTIIRKRREC
jgi:Ni/Co efflux regulator RcnB